jgi:hypothetical protein
MLVYYICIIVKQTDYERYDESRKHTGYNCLRFRRRQYVRHTQKLPRSSERGTENRGEYPGI